MIRLGGKWEPRVPTQFKHAVRGDELRKFTSKHGDEFELTVDYYSYWKWSARMNGESIGSESGFGTTSKAEAKRKAERYVRTFIERGY